MTHKIGDKICRDMMKTLYHSIQCTSSYYQMKRNHLLWLVQLYSKACGGYFVVFLVGVCKLPRIADSNLGAVLNPPSLKYPVICCRL